MFISENLQGQTRGTLQIVKLARSRPLSWLCKCLSCGTQQTLQHETLQTNPRCRFSGCGKEQRSSGTSGGMVAIRETAARSLDSTQLSREFRQFATEEQQKEQAKAIRDANRRPSLEELEKNFDPTKLTVPGKVPW